MIERLQKILARAGLGARRHCESLVRGGRVRVDGQVVRKLGAKADPEKSEITCQGKRVACEKKVYFVVNKPAGYISNISDDRERPCVVHLIPRVSQRLFTVGRLARESEGLMVLTNDGDLLSRATHPRSNITHTYLATVSGSLSPTAVSKIGKGVRVGDLKTAPCKVAVRRRLKRSSVLEITLHEGRNREIRRVFAKLGHPVSSLKRIKIGSLSLGALKSGKYQRTTRKALMEAIGIEVSSDEMLTTLKTRVRRRAQPPVSRKALRQVSKARRRR